MNNSIILLVGKSGSGKTTIAKYLKKLYGWQDIDSYTTRPPRQHYWYYGIQEGRQPNKNTSYAVSASSVITLMNNYRAQNGIAACSTDSVLMTAAQERARELADNEMFAHSRPDGSKWQTVLGDNLSLYVRVGENLGRGQSSATSAIYAWQHSTTHNALLLNSNMNSVGVGVAKSASGQYYFVLIAGQKR